MAWEKTGTVSVTNGSAVVAGTGTDWVAALQAGWGFVGPDGRTYEILSVDSAAQITLAAPYGGVTQAGQTYSAFPTQSLAQGLTASLQALISNYQSVYDKAGQGLFQNGTLAAPGISFDQDPDTGLFRSGSNILSLITGAVEQLRLSAGWASGAAVQSSGLDASEGKLMRTRAFGLGATTPAVLGDLDDQSAPLGFYGVNAETSGTRPPNAAPYGMCIFLRYGGTALGQIFLSNFGGGIYCRTASVSGWSDWETVFSSTTLVGAVSQNAGTPTGAVVERGNNANGHYVRFADGTQICTVDGVTFAYGAAPYLEFVWNHPAAFAETPNRFATLSHLAAEYTGCALTDFGHVVCHNGSSAAAVRIVHGPGAADFVSGDQVANCRITAIGRWF